MYTWYRVSIMCTFEQFYLTIFVVSKSFVSLRNTHLKFILLYTENCKVSKGLMIILFFWISFCNFDYSFTLNLKSQVYAIKTVYIKFSTHLCESLVRKNKEFYSQIQSEFVSNFLFCMVNHDVSAWNRGILIEF